MKTNGALLGQEFERVRKRQRTIYSQTQEQIDKLLQNLSKCLALLESQPEGAEEGLPLKPLVSMLHDNIAKADPRKKISAEQKAYHKTLSAFSKAIDKSLPTDLSKAYRDVPFDTGLLDSILAQHLYRTARFQSAEAFEKESTTEVPAETKDLFIRMHHILDALKQKDILPALEWAKEHRLELEEHKSSLEFDLHKMNYIQLLQNKQRDAAILYARAHFPPFGSVNMAEIQRLMGCLAFVTRVESSPYADLFLPSRWEDLERTFSRSFFLANTLPQQSHLTTTVTVGAKVLPKFIKLAEAMRLQGKSAEWESLTTVPVDMELSDSQQFHTLFVCPVTKETGTPSNPPMLLVCGHVISALALQKLPTRAGGRFKCPYCPVEQRAQQARQIHF